MMKDPNSGLYIGVFCLAFGALMAVSAAAGAMIDKDGGIIMDDWKVWAKAALIRAIRTFAEAMLAYIGTGALVLGDVNWIAALSAGGFGFVTAILLALTGLPEVSKAEPPDQPDQE